MALDALKKSYKAFERARGAGGGARQRDTASKALGALNGDLTRLRQTICHPAAVNASRKAAGDEIIDDEGNVLPMSDAPPPRGYFSDASPATPRPRTFGRETGARLRYSSASRSTPRRRRPARPSTG